MKNPSAQTPKDSGVRGQRFWSKYSDVPLPSPCMVWRVGSMTKDVPALEITALGAKDFVLFLWFPSSGLPFSLQATIGGPKED
jgi:hypothetical protein